MNVMEVSGLTKKYEKFALDNVSFYLKTGKITGFIGRNGAGKSTTLKAIFDFVHPDGGTVKFFDKEFKENQAVIKQNVGFVSGGVDYYPHKKLRKIISVTKIFYDNWDNNLCNKYMQMFNLDENKTPSQLSEGMKVKFAITLALSHHAKLLILDEPTSGLDPVSREELLDVFLQLCEDGITILFSTHITSDLDKVADNIVYIRNGKIITQSRLNDFVNSYMTVAITENQLSDSIKPYLIGCKKSKNGYTAIVKSTDVNKINLQCEKADLDSVMIHMEKENSNENA